jgi:hypothetical protein
MCVVVPLSPAVVQIHLQPVQPVPFLLALRNSFHPFSLSAVNRRKEATGDVIIVRYADDGIDTKPSGSWSSCMNETLSPMSVSNGVLQSNKTPEPQKDPQSRKSPVKDSPHHPNEEPVANNNPVNENNTANRVTERDRLSEDIELDPSHYRG